MKKDNGDKLKSLDSTKLKKLKEALEQFPLELAVLFGSQASGDATRMSDLDLAVKFSPTCSKEDKFKLLDKVTVKVTECTGFEAVDLVDLETVGAELGYRALRTGTLLMGKKS